MIKKGWDGNYQLVDKDNVVQEIGNKMFTEPNHVEWELKDGTAPHKASSTGKVYIVLCKDDRSREFYPGVFNLEWKKI